LKSDRIKMLEEELSALKLHGADGEIEAVGDQADKLVALAARGGWKTLYRIGKSKRLYLGEPEWMHAERGIKLRASMPLKDLDLYLERHPELSFIHFKDYALSHFDDSSDLYSIDEVEEDPDVLPPPRPTSESIQFMSPELISAVDDLLTATPGFYKAFPNYELEDEIEAPYMAFYFLYPHLPDLLTKLPRESQAQLAVLVKFLEQTSFPLYQEVLASLEKGEISSAHLSFLVKPGDIIVRLEPYVQAFMVTGWLFLKPVIDFVQKRKDKKRKKALAAAAAAGLSEWGEEEGEEEALGKGVKVLTYSVMSWRWMGRNDGYVARVTFPMDLKVQVKRGCMLTISDMTWFPIRYASPEVVQLLTERGKRYLSLGRMQILGYAEQGDGGLDVVGYLLRILRQL